MTETLAYGTYLRVLSESYPMNTNMTGFRRFSKYLCHFALDKSSLSLGRVYAAWKALTVVRGSWGEVS